MGRRAGGRAVLGRLGIFGLVGAACMGPTGGAQQLDRAIEARVDAMALPRAPWSPLDAIDRGVRVRLDEGAVELDDVAVWLGLGEGSIDRRTAEGDGPPWTHVRGIELGSGEAELHSPALIAAMERMRDGAAVTGRGGEQGRYVLFADAGVPFDHVVRVLYNAGQAELRRPSLAARRGDGTMGALPVATGPEFCEDDGVERPSHSGHTAECWQPEVVVVEQRVVVRGQRSWQRTGECIRVQRYEPADARESAKAAARPTSSPAALPSL